VLQFAGGDFGQQKYLTANFKISLNGGHAYGNET